MAVARYFDKDKYDGSFPYGGVPLRDIEDAEWERLPKHVQDSADALPYFRKSNPAPQPRAAKRDEGDS